MKPSIRQKLEFTQSHLEEVEALLSAPGAAEDTERFSKLSKEYTELEPLVATFKTFVGSENDLHHAQQLCEDEDPEIRTLAKDEVTQIKGRLNNLEESLNEQLLMQDPRDNLNVFLEIRAGTGGDEAGLFVNDLLRMYTRYVEAQGWKFETLNLRPSEAGGYKEVICRIEGNSVYGQLKFESGVHRVQRIPETESQGRIHTSACTVAVLPEPKDLEDIEIDRKDLRIDTFRASGSGGQHVNKTDSAIRITHLPSGTVVECQQERSQHKNRMRAMGLLQARLMNSLQEKAIREQAQSRKELVGSGDRSERIRTYNFPQSRVTDHRIGLTLHKLDDIMEGELALVIKPLCQEDRTNKITALADSP